VFAVGEQGVDAVVGLDEQRFDLSEARFGGDVSAGDGGDVLFEFGDAGDEVRFGWAVRHWDSFRCASIMPRGMMLGAEVTAVSKYVFVTNVTISMHTEVEADGIDAAVEEARCRGVVSLCNQCAHGEPDAWCTSGELDGDPASSPLVEVTVDDEVLTGRAFGRVRRLWRDG